jgi:hypothetical protein
MFHGMFGPRFLFDGDGGGSGGTEGQGGNSGSTPQGGGAGGASGGAGDGEKKPEPTAAEKARSELLKLKPEELADRLLTTESEVSRVSHESAQRKAALKKFEEAEQKRLAGELTEVDRLKKENETLTKAQAESRARIKRVTISSAVRSTASKLNFADPADAERFVAHDGLPYDEEKDEVEAKAVETALKKLATDKPYLLAKVGPTKPNTDGDSGPSGDKADEDALKRRFGI